ncbi:MAG: hypothetical protein ACYS9X_14545 [Planctomycetota bacterium]|jgi:hypothetical protein
MVSLRSGGSRLPRLLRTSVLKGALVVACVAGCSFHDGAGDTGGEHAGGAVAEVGSVRIGEADVSYRAAVERAYGNTSATRAAALVLLVSDALEGEMAREVGVDASLEEIAALSKHADETSKAPKILAEVKRVFGEDKAAYERLYLAPKVVNRKLRDWYGRDEGIHTRERASIEKAFGLVSAGASLERAAEECGLDFRTYEGGGADRPTPPALARYFPRGVGDVRGALESILDSLPVGAVHDGIVEDEVSFRVVKLVERSGSEYKAEAIAAPKRSFDQWFRERAARIEIRITDAKLARAVRDRYSNVWWVKRRSTDE